VTTVTTAKPATTTTAKPTTTTAIPADKASVTIVNNYPATMVVSVNGVSQTVGAGQRKGPFAVTPKATDGNDVVTLRRSDDPSCGTGSAGGWFDAGGKYELQLFVSAPSGCNGDKPSPGGRVEPGGGTI